jgi:hypothetical protein
MLLNPLDDKYFGIICKKYHDGYDYYAIYPRKPSIVLFSEQDSTAIAAISFRPQDCNSLNIQTFITKEYDDFQGLISKNEQEYEFIITNLTDLGEIKIDIMNTNKSVQMVNPGHENGGLNEVNELDPLQSYPVRGDQKNSLSLVLDSPVIKYISVVPQKDNLNLVKKFENTKWDCSDFFCIRISKDRIASKKEYNKIICPINKRSEKGRKVNTRGLYTNIEYEYNVPTNLDNKLCSINLSVNDNILPGLLLPPDELLDAGKLAVNETINMIERNIYRTSILQNMTTIYEEKECVICLDSDQSIDCVLFQCGHKCCHFKCSSSLTICPICRQRIASVIQI